MIGDIMSYRLLVVDDEELICKSIESILQRADLPKLGEVLYTCDPQNGLKLIKKSHFDIVITDIKMPGMDGLALIKSTEGMAQKPRFIILSGYDDFQYARNAFRLKVVDYLLKPVAIADLEESILAAIHAIENDAIKNVVDAKDVPGRSEISLIMSDYLNSRKNAANDTIQESEKLSLLMSRRLFFVCACGVFNEDYQAVNGLADELYIMLSDRLDIAHNVFFTQHTDQSNFDIFVFNCEDDITYKYVLACIEEFIRTVPGSSERKIIISASKTATQINMLHKLYTQAIYNMRYRILHGESTLIKHCDCDTGKDKFEIDQRTVNLFIEDLIKVKLNRIIRFADETFNVESLREYKIEAIERLYVGLLNIITISAKELYIEQSFESVIEQKEFGSFNSVREMRLYLKNLIYKLFVSEKRKLLSPIEIAKKYVKENLDKNVDMTIIANEVDISYVYFSQMFKQEVGMTFSDYLLTQRMIEAKKLLRNPSFKVQEIAAKLGYKNPKNFSRAFKKYYGLSPKDYIKKGR